MIKTANSFLPVEATSLHCLHSVLTWSLLVLLSCCSSALVSEKFGRVSCEVMFQLQFLLAGCTDTILRQPKEVRGKWGTCHSRPSSPCAMLLLTPTIPKCLSLHDVITTDITANALARRQWGDFRELYVW